MKINRKSIFLKLILLWIAVVLFHCQSHEVTQEQNFYGEYGCPTKGIGLDLLPPNKFVLTKIVSYSDDMLMTSTLSAGTFKKVESTIELKDAKTEQIISLLIEDDEVLVAKEVTQLNSGDKLLSWSKYHNNGQQKSHGGWYNNEKMGLWSYWDDEGELLYEINYENGVALDTLNVGGK